MTTPERSLAVVGEGEGLARWADWLARSGHAVVCLEPPLSLARVSTVLAGCEAVFDVSHAATEVRASRMRTLQPYLARGAWFATTELTKSATALAVATGVHVITLGDWVPPWETALLEVAVADGVPPDVRERALACLGGLGLEMAVVGDQVGLVFARTLAMLVNEAAFALQDGVASAADLDLAMCLGANYPRGPLAWADRIGPARILGVLEGLHAEFADPRYRPCPLLRRKALLGEPFHGEPGTTGAAQPASAS